VLKCKKGKILKGKRWHSFAYVFLRALVSPFIARKFRFEYDDIKVSTSPYIVIGNHLTNWDPILIGFSFKKPMYYVATDQIFRMGWKSKLLVFIFAPIARAKTVNETQTVISIFKKLRDNSNVCIFAEGNSSFDGETCEIQPSIGKLVKRAGGNCNIPFFRSLLYISISLKILQLFIQKH
jgi:1-acyl-sn-glycerol-3-phosphate acyltransferase